MHGLRQKEMCLRVYFHRQFFLLYSQRDFKEIKDKLKLCVNCTHTHTLYAHIHIKNELKQRRKKRSN